MSSNIKVEIVVFRDAGFKTRQHEAAWNIPEHIFQALRVGDCLAIDGFDRNDAPDELVPSFEITKKGYRLTKHNDNYISHTGFLQGNLIKDPDAKPKHRW